MWVTMILPVIFNICKSIINQEKKDKTNVFSVRARELACSSPMLHQSSRLISRPPRGFASQLSVDLTRQLGKTSVSRGVFRCSAQIYPRASLRQSTTTTYDYYLRCTHRPSAGPLSICAVFYIYRDSPYRGSFGLDFRLVVLGATQRIPILLLLLLLLPVST